MRWWHKFLNREFDARMAAFDERVATLHIRRYSTVEELERLRAELRDNPFFED